MLGVFPNEVQYRRTRKGWHLVIVLRGIRLTPAETVAFQFAFGSDANRESLNLMRAMRLKGAPRLWQKRWNILYEFKLK